MMYYCSYPTSLARFTIKVIGLLTSCFTNQCEVNWVIIYNHEHSFCCTEATGLLTYFESQVDNAPLIQTECIFSHTDLRTSPLPPLPPHPRHLGRSQTTVVRLVEKPLVGVRLPRRPWLHSRERSVGPALPDSPLAQGLTKKSGHEDPLYFGHDAQLHQGRMWSSADWNLVSMAPGPQG